MTPPPSAPGRAGDAPGGPRAGESHQAGIILCSDSLSSFLGPLAEGGLQETCK